MTAYAFSKSRTLSIDEVEKVLPPFVLRDDRISSVMELESPVEDCRVFFYEGHCQITFINTGNGIRVLTYGKWMDGDNFFKYLARSVKDQAVQYVVTDNDWKLSEVSEDSVTYSCLGSDNVRYSVKVHHDLGDMMAEQNCEFIVG